MVCECVFPVGVGCCVVLVLADGVRVVWCGVLLAVGSWLLGGGCLSLGVGRDG